MLLCRARVLILTLFALGLVLTGRAGAASAPPVLLVLGDSVSASYGLAAGQGWVTLLSQRIKAEGYRYVVVNGSIIFFERDISRIQISDLIIRRSSVDLNRLYLFP